MDRLFCFLFFIFLSGCSSAPKERTGVEYHEDKEGHFIKLVYKQDTLQSEERLQKDSITLDGKAAYYKNGQLHRLAHYKNGVLNGSYIQYYEDGNPELFICHDSYGDTIFLRSYDKDGSVIKEEGELIPTGFVSNNNLKSSQQVDQVRFIVKPPKMRITIDNYYLFNDLRDTLRHVREHVEYDWLHVYTYRIPVPGTYKHIQVTSIYDSATGNEYRVRDSLVSTFSW